ncbi:MAG: hypothetical protein EHM24_15395 [Acidobacteria bacterium]|nr:MAG: hypothetical protein EHM24_15395 [Acidobacteriota bacterium]
MGFFADRAGFRSQDSGFRSQDSGFRSQDSGVRIQDSGDHTYKERAGWLAPPGPSLVRVTPRIPIPDS